jgi:hypothetical protein
MAEDKPCAAEKIISVLVREGWKIQKAGINYVNNTIGTNLYKDGEVITVQQEFYPDEELIQQECPDEQK